MRPEEGQATYSSDLDEWKVVVRGGREGSEGRGWQRKRYFLEGSKTRDELTVQPQFGIESGSASQLEEGANGW